MIKTNIKLYKNTRIFQYLIIEFLSYIVMLIIGSYFLYIYFQDNIAIVTILGMWISFIVIMFSSFIKYIKSVWVIGISENGITLINKKRQEKFIHWSEINDIKMTAFGPSTFRILEYGIILNKIDNDCKNFLGEIVGNYYKIHFGMVSKKILHEILNAYGKQKESIKLDNANSQKQKMDMKQNNPNVRNTKNDNEKIDWRENRTSEEWKKMSKSMIILTTIMTFLIVVTLGMELYNKLGEPPYIPYTILIIIISIVISIVYFFALLRFYYSSRPSMVGFSENEFYFLYRYKKKEKIPFKKIISIVLMEHYEDYKIIYYKENENTSEKIISNEIAKKLKQKFLEYNQ